MVDKTLLANMTFAHCAISRTVLNIDATGETTVEADQFNAFYPTVMSSVIMQYMPDFPQRQVALSLIQENPNLTYDYEYSYPSDCLIARDMNDGLQLGVDLFNTIPYQVANDGNERVIWSNQDAPNLNYISDFDVIDKMPPSFALALSLIIASYIAPAITENRNSGVTLSKRGHNEMAIAMAGQANERGAHLQADAETIRGRA